MVKTGWVYLIVFLGFWGPAGARAEDPPGTVVLDRGWACFEPGPGSTGPPGVPPGSGQGRWVSYGINRAMPGREGNYLILKRTLPGPFETPSLFLPRASFSESMEIFLGDRRIAGIGKMEMAPVNHHLGVRWYLVPLPRESAGKELYIRFFSSDPASIGFRLPPVVGEHFNLTRDCLTVHRSRLLLAAFFFVAGLMGFSLFIRTYGRRNRLLLSFTTLAVFAGIYLIPADTNLGVLFSEDPVLLSRVRYVSFFLFVAGLWSFYTVTVGPGQWRSGQILLCISLLSAVWVIPLDILAGRHIHTFFNISMAVQMCGIACYFITLVQNTIQGDAVARGLCIGIIAMGVTGFHDMARAMTMPDPEPVLFHWGLLYLIGSMAWVIALLYRQERQNAEAVLRASEEKYRSLFENTPLSILEADLGDGTGRILKYNRHAAATLDLGRDPATGHPLADIFSEAAMAFLPGMREETAAGKVFTRETVCQRLNGECFPARLIATAAVSPAPDNIIIALQDITDEKQRRSEEVAIDEERRRIAREIHDGLAQDLASLRMKAGIWHTLMDRDPERMHRELDEFRDVLSYNIREVRRSIFALRSMDLEELGFFAALQKLIQGFEDQNSFRVDFSLLGNRDRLPGRLEPVVFRIIQEALNNAAKHAGAGRVEIRLDLGRPDALSLEILDDGRGIDTDSLAVARRTGHVGISQIQERITSLGGTVDIGNRKGAGMCINVSLPV